MKPIRLPEPLSPKIGVPEIFDDGSSGVIRRAVIIGDGIPSSEKQSLGLIRALGLSDKHVLYRVTRPSGWINDCLQWLPISLHKKLDHVLRLLYRYFHFVWVGHGRKLARISSTNGSNVGIASVLEANSKHIASMAKDSFKKDGPLLVVACGRDTVSVASSIKRLAADNVFVVQIELPKLHLNRFDLIITPRHDYYPLTPPGQEQLPWFLRKWICPREPPDEHIFLTIGALHQIDFATLRSAASEWHDEFAPLPKPLLVVNVGGPTSQCHYGTDVAKQLTTNLLNVLGTSGTVRISFSSRTPEKVSHVIIQQLVNIPGVYIWDGQEPSPYIGHLAWADAFVITADSISMISEACSTGKPVYIMGSECCTWKLSDFHKTLKERGIVRPFTGFEDISETWSYPPLNDTGEAARRLVEVLAQHGMRLRS